MINADQRRLFLTFTLIALSQLSEGPALDPETRG